VGRRRSDDLFFHRDRSGSRRWSDSRGAARGLDSPSDELVGTTTLVAQTQLLEAFLQNVLVLELLAHALAAHELGLREVLQLDRALGGGRHRSLDALDDRHRRRNRDGCGRLGLERRAGLLRGADRAAQNLPLFNPYRRSYGLGRRDRGLFTFVHEL